MASVYGKGMTNTTATIEVEQIMTKADGVMYVAHGPDDHRWLLKRFTEQAAREDGLAYFMASRALIDGKWQIIDPSGNPVVL